LRSTLSANVSLPKISVVTPSLNQGRLIEGTLRSIHDQAYPNLEHIVIDGGSTDETREVIGRYEDKIAFWSSEPDEGQTHALVKGFSRATGDIFCWLNSDDLFASRTLWEVAGFFDSHDDVDFVYGDSQWVDVEGRFIKPKREHRWNRFVWLNDHNYIPQPSSFWKANLYREVGGLDTSFDLAMDADLWIRFAEVTRPAHVSRIWSAMRFYPEQKNTRLRDRSLAEMARIRGRYQTKAPSPLTTSLRSLGARSLRVGLKLLSGGYPPSELARHIPQLIGGQSWEERQSAARRGS
jgi:glycosyltransferase involved in cell wall biosynthesis